MTTLYQFDPAADGLSCAPAIMAVRGAWIFYLAAADDGAYQLAAADGTKCEAPVAQFDAIDADQGAAILRDLFGMGEVPPAMLDELKAAAVAHWSKA